ncbi:hypothetical protein FRC07_008658 [Ceratobasidium sp. 392]|nr:hypothetical protein FRC07_008658 [Ceratobasidium sp. 392]
MTVLAKIVGELACQQNSYLNNLQTAVVSCIEVVATKAETKRTKKNKEQGQQGQSAEPDLIAGETKLWEIECEDSILFPEGGGQPTDHGTLTTLNELNDPIPVTTVRRDGLRAVIFSPRPLAPGTFIIQHVDSRRRMDHMQQHTGQHLLSAVMDTYPGLETLGWGMGASIFVGNSSDSGAVVNMNYVELGRRPTDAEIAEIQDKCNEIVRENRPITISTPLDAKHDSLPSDYDKDQGVVRVVTIDGIDANPVASTLSSGTSPTELSARATQVTNALRDALRAKRKLETEIAQYVAANVLRQKSTWVHRADAGLDFLMDVVAAIPPAELPTVLVLAAGAGSDGGSVLIVGTDAGSVQDVAAKATASIRNLKGGGKGIRWQGKVQVWEKGNLDALENIAKNRG